MPVSLVLALSKLSGLWPFTVVDRDTIKFSVPLAFWNIFLCSTLLIILWRQLPGVYSDGITTMGYYAMDISSTVHASFTLLLPVFLSARYVLYWERCIKIKAKLEKMTNVRTGREHHWKLFCLICINGLVIGLDFATNWEHLMVHTRWLLMLIPLIVDMALTYSYDFWMTQIRMYLKWLNHSLLNQIDTVFWARDVHKFQLIIQIYFEIFKLSEQVAAKYGLHVVYLYLAQCLRIFFNVYQLSSGIYLPSEVQIAWIFLRMAILLHICHCSKLIDTQLAKLSCGISKAWNRVKSNSPIANQVQWFGVMLVDCRIRLPGDIYFTISFVKLFEAIGTITTTAVIFAQAAKLSPN